jgi:fatty acid desaturase
VAELPELGSLRTELRAAGAFEPRELQSWVKLTFLLTGVVACLGAIAVFGWIAVPLIPVASVLSTSTTMFGHEGSHRSFSRSPARNTLLQHITFPLFAGLSALYWREKHDRLHHGNPNVEGKDPDLQPFPFVSSAAAHQRCGPGRRWFQRHLQRWAFWPMSTLMAVGMRGSSLIYLARYPFRQGIDRHWIADVLCLVAHYGLWLLAASLIWGPIVAFAVYSAVWGLVGVLLALIFAPAHMGLPVTDGQNRDWLHQLETTRDLELPRFVSWFFIGLDYQVEHHLFPRIPHQALPHAQRITEAWCRREGVTHQSVPYLPALVHSARFMAGAWHTPAADPDAVRLHGPGAVGGADPSGCLQDLRQSG